MWDEVWVRGAIARPYALPSPCVGSAEAIGAVSAGHACRSTGLTTKDGSGPRGSSSASSLVFGAWREDLLNGFSSANVGRFVPPRHVLVEKVPVRCYQLRVFKPRSRASF